MIKDEFLSRLTEIGTCEDEVERRELIATLTEEAGSDYDALATLTEQNQTLTQDNETLREANMKMFLRVTEKSPNTKDELGIDPPKEKRKFEDLFNEKGVLK